ncbi:MAG: GAF domain-containing protein [bacterium]|nr:GAF domain-containing protein [bacterium]
METAPTQTAASRPELADLIRRQAAASAELTTCTTLEEMAGALARHLIGPGQYVAMNIFVYDEQGQFNGFRTLATANRQNAYRNDQFLPLTLADLNDSVRRSVVDQQPLVLSDLQNDSTIVPSLKAWGTGSPTISTIMLPMRSLGQSFGMVNINSVRDVLHPDSQEVALYQTLADQVGALVRLHRLTETAASIRDISERQALAFNELVAGQDAPEMGRIVARYMLPEPERFLTIFNVTKGEHGRPSAWTPLLTANREQIFYWNTALPFKSEDLSSELHRALLRSEGHYLPDAAALSPEKLSEQVGPAVRDWLTQNLVKQALFAPILAGDDLVDVLVVGSHTDGAFSREEINAFNSVSSQMGALLNARRLMQQSESARHVVDNLVLASRLISVAASTDYMARGVMYTLGRMLTAAAITEFDRVITANQLPERHTLISFSTTADVLPFEENEQNLVLPTTANLARLHAGLPLVETGDAVHEWLPKSLRAQLGEKRVTWLASFGLRSGDDLLGMLVLMHTSAYALTSEELDAYTSLADQIGVAMRIRQLLEQTRQAQAIASSLVSTNRIVASANNYTEMSAAILQGMPDAVQLVALLIFDSPVIDGEIPSYIITEAVATRSETDRPRVVDSLDADNPVAAAAIARLQLGEAIHIQDARLQETAGMLDDASDRPLLPIPNTIRYMRTRGIFRFTAVGLRTGAQLLGIMAVGARQDAAVDTTQLDNIMAVADQLALTFENRRLLDQTAEALGFVQAQYETTNTLYSAQTPLEMLAALYAFTDGTFERAHLALVRPEEAGMLTVIAEIDGGDIQETSRETRLSDYYDLNLNSTSDDDLSSTDHTISGQQRGLLEARSRGAFLTLPMTGTNRRLLGVVNFNSESPGRMPFNRTRALRNLVDQLAVVLENRDLLRRTEEGLEEARTLYNINSKLLEAQDAAQVLRVLMENVARDAASISMTRIEYDSEGIISNAYQEFIVTPERTGQSTHNILTGATEEERLRFHHSWNTTQRVIRIVEDVDDSTNEVNLLSYLKASGVRSYVTLPIYDEGRLVKRVNISWTQPRRFDSRTRRIYEALRDQVAIVLQNQDLVRDMQLTTAQLGRQVRVLQNINQLAASLTSTQSEKAMLDLTCQALVNALGVGHANIALLDENGQFAYVVSEYPDMSSIGFQIRPDNPLHAEMRRELRPVLLDRTKPDTELDITIANALDELGIRKLALLPLVNARGSYMGAVGLDSFDLNYQFTPEVLDTARTIVTQVGVNLQNIRLLQESQRQAQQFQQIAALGQLLQSTLDIDELLKLSLTSAGRVVQADHIALMLLNTEQNRLHVVATRDGAALWIDRVGKAIDLENRVGGLVWRNGAPLRIIDLRSEPALRATLAADALSVMAQPIYTRGVVIGVVEVASTRRQAYDATDAAIFQQLVSQISVAIENADAYAQSQRLAKSKALINDITSQLQQQVELERMLDVTMNELGKALGARRARVRLAARNPETQPQELPQGASSEG